jgi:hypothetical protein
MAINSGTLKTSGVAKGTEFTHGTAPLDTAANIGQFADTRRTHDFGDRVAELTPEESPFFVYLSKVAKRPTVDPVFRFIENRSKIDWTSRNFFLAAAEAALVAGTEYSISVDDGSASIDWLIKGMVIAIETVDDTNGKAYTTVRIQDAPVDAGSTTTFTGLVIATSHASITGYGAAADDAPCTVIGTAFEEGSGSPDVWSSQLDDEFGYTQIFKTSAEMTNSAIATNYRGYANEWQRIWNLKLREHKVDIERAMLFGQKARRGGIQYSEGLIGMIVSNAGAATGGTTALSYTAGSPYYRTVTTTEFSYDLFLSDFEVLFDPARGGSSDKLALASLPVITMFNKLGAGATFGHAATSSFMDNTLSGSTDAGAYNIDFGKIQGSFGHNLMKIDTVHGSLALVKEPLFRGFANSMLSLIDMKQVAYRPLVGNGLNRDTHIITNVQQADEDLRKDMILTEAGLEVALPETHMLYNFEGV